MADGKRFDEFTRIWAAPITRRRALRMSAGAALGAVGASLLGSTRASAQAECVVNSQCQPFEVCNSAGFCQGCRFDSQCGPGNGCFGSVIGGCQCILPGGSGGVQCNTACCNGTCCPPGQTACVNGACACPAGGPVCGSSCCRKGESCSDAANGCCCPKGSTPCGTSCCAAGVACMDRTLGMCGCPAGTTPCGSGASLTCCPAGTACGSGGCAAPSNNTVQGYCLRVQSDRNVKEHVTLVRWA